MPVVNMLEAKTNLSKLVEAVQSGKQDEIIIARNGRPAARLVPLPVRDVSRRLGLFDGMYEIPKDISWSDQELDEMFGDHTIEPRDDEA